MWRWCTARVDERLPFVRYKDNDIQYLLKVYFRAAKVTRKAVGLRLNLLKWNLNVIFGSFNIIPGNSSWRTQRDLRLNWSHVEFKAETWKPTGSCYYHRMSLIEILNTRGSSWYELVKRLQQVETSLFWNSLYFRPPAVSSCCLPPNKSLVRSRDFSDTALYSHSFYFYFVILTSLRRAFSFANRTAPSPSVPTFNRDIYEARSI